MRISFWARKLPLSHDRPITPSFQIDDEDEEPIDPEPPDLQMEALSLSFRTRNASGPETSALGVEKLLLERLLQRKEQRLVC